MTAEPDRSALRMRMRDARRAIPPRQRLAAAEATVEHLRALVAELTQASKIAGYWACDGELPLHPLLAGAVPFTYLLPKLSKGKQLEFVGWRPSDPITANRFGIPEPSAGATVDPSTIDVILLPLLVFDRRGRRLGTGGGYYDRALAFTSGKPRGLRPWLIGVGYGLQEVSELRTEPWDIDVDHVVTENGVIDCAASA